MTTELFTSKQQIAQRFGQSAAAYHRLATLQQDCARQLLRHIADYQSQLPDGTLLEIGCGTGFLTQGLVRQFRQRPLYITDLSLEMLQFCQSHCQSHCQSQSIAPHPHLQFSQLDGEQLDSLPQTYAAIVSSFAFQWLHHPAIILRSWLDRLLPQGCLFLAFPTCHSYPEWRSICAQLQLPCTVNRLPDPDSLLSTLPRTARLLHASTTEVVTSHPSAIDFFRSFKAIGAEVSQSQQHLTPSQLRSLIQYWDRQRLDKLSGQRSSQRSSLCSDLLPRPLQIHHHIAFWVLQRLP